MSDYTANEDYWRQSSQGQYNFDSSNFGQPTDSQQLEFQTYSDEQSTSYPAYKQNLFTGDMYRQNNFTEGTTGFTDEADEPPLLEELGIDLDRILEKMLAVLNPFHRKGQIDDANYLLQDSDLAGPIAFCLLLAGFLSLAGSKSQFGYVYGLATISCVLMYILLSLMSNSSNISLSSIASVLGYCLLPIVALAGFSIFTTLRGSVGLGLAIFAVTWSTTSASRLLTTVSGEENQRLLIAYPCALLYGVFTLIVIF